MQVRRARGSILAALLGLAVLPAALPLGLPVAAAGRRCRRRHLRRGRQAPGRPARRNRARHRRHDRADRSGRAGLVGRRHHRGERRRRRADPGSGRHASSPGHRRRRRPRLDARDRRHDPRARAARLTPCLCDRRPPQVSRPTTRSRAASRVGRVALIKVDAEPAEVGFDASRLARIDRHFRRYVDDGLLAGWTVAVSRRGRVAHLSHQGLRDLDAGLPVDGRHDLAHLLDDQADHVGRGHDALRAGRAGADRPGGALHPVLRRRPRLQCRAGAEPVDGPGHRARARLAPAHPHLRAHLRLPPRAPGRRDVPPERLRLLQSARRGPRRGVRPARRAPAAVPARHRVELRRSRRTCWAGSSRSPRGSRFDTFLAEHVLGPLGMDDTGVVGRRGGPRPARHALHARTGRRPRGEHGPRRGGDPPAGAARRRGRAGVDGGGLPPLHPDAAARR